MPREPVHAPDLIPARVMRGKSVGDRVLPPCLRGTVWLRVPAAHTKHIERYVSPVSRHITQRIQTNVTPRSLGSGHAASAKVTVGRRQLQIEVTRLSRYTRFSCNAVRSPSVQSSR